MTSEELNVGIAALCNDEQLTSSDEKPIPYIGWWWRMVDFNSPYYEFGVVPTGTPAATMHNGDTVTPIGPFSENDYIGFMENNKWDYPYSRKTEPDEWAELKRLLEVAVTEKTADACANVRQYMQRFLKPIPAAAST